jgi:hypothetical protein
MSSGFEMFHPSGRPYTMLELMDKYDEGWNTRPLNPEQVRRMMNTYQPSVDTSYKNVNKKKALFSKLRKTIVKAAAEKKETLQKEKEKQNALLHEEALSKRAALLEEGKKVDFIKEGYAMFDDEFQGKDGYAEFIATRDYSQAEKSVKEPLEKIMKGQEITPEHVRDYLAKKFAGFYEKVYMKKKATAAASASASASKPKKGGARKTKKGRKAGRKTRKTSRKAGRKH